MIKSCKKKNCCNSPGIISLQQIFKKSQIKKKWERIIILVFFRINRIKKKSINKKQKKTQRKLRIPGISSTVFNLKVPFRRASLTHNPVFNFRLGIQNYPHRRLHVHPHFPVANHRIKRPVYTSTKYAFGELPYVAKYTMVQSFSNTCLSHFFFLTYGSINFLVRECDGRYGSLYVNGNVCLSLFFLVFFLFISIWW